MKRIITSFLAMLLLAFTIIPITVSGAEKDAIKSPALSDGTITVEDNGGKATAEIIHYSERSKLSDAERQTFETAYGILSSNYNDLTKISSIITQKAKELYLGADELAVSDYFAVKVTSKDNSGCSVTLSTALMEDYVAFLRYENGQWKSVDNVKWSSDGKYITFTAYGTYPYAVIVEAAKEDERSLPIENREAPKMTYTGGDGTVYLIVTPYKDKETLSRPKERALEQCYRMIEATSSVVELNAQLDDIAEEKGFDTKNIGVSQLFDISPTEEKGIRFVVQLTTDAKDFVSLLHFKNGEWVVVDDVTVNYEDNSISFASADFSPFAIVSNGAAVSPQTGDNSQLLLWLLILVVSVMCLIITIGYSHRRNKEEK